MTVLGIARRGWQRFRALVDGLLHPVRRRHAVRALRNGAPPERILVVCHGNICRSPYAAGVLRRMLSAGAGNGVHVSSAGFIGPDRPSPPEAVTVAARHGVILERHRSRLLTAKLIAEADLILVMDARQQRALRGEAGGQRHRVLQLGDFDPAAVRSRTIEDPVEQPAAVFEACYERIDRCIGVVVSALATDAAQPPE